ncbi:MAG: dienelactone hydrolase family protein [Cyanobacteria bacterium P01_E01_bin.35]
MQIEQKEIIIATPDGEMPAFLCVPNKKNSLKSAIVVLMEAFGLTEHIKEVAARIASEGYLTITPDLYYRQLPNNKFGYDEVELGKSVLHSLDFDKTVEEDIKAALDYLKSRVDVDRIGVTGFCFGGSMAFYTATKFSAEISAVAPFYAVVLDEWLEAVKNITIPVYLFFGDSDPFIPKDRIEQIESRLRKLGKNYNLKVYENADHGFFCHERSSYNQEAAENSWRELKEFFKQYLEN